MKLFLDPLQVLDQVLRGGQDGERVRAVLVGFQALCTSASLCSSLLFARMRACPSLLCVAAGVGLSLVVAGVCSPFAEDEAPDLGVLNAALSGKNAELLELQSERDRLEKSEVEIRSACFALPALLMPGTCSPA